MNKLDKFRIRPENPSLRIIIYLRMFMDNIYLPMESASIRPFSVPTGKQTHPWIYGIAMVAMQQLRLKTRYPRLFFIAHE